MVSQGWPTHTHKGACNLQKNLRRRDGCRCGEKGRSFAARQAARANSRPNGTGIAWRQRRWRGLHTAAGAAVAPGSASSATSTSSKASDGTPKKAHDASPAFQAGDGPWRSGACHGGPAPWMPLAAGDTRRVTDTRVGLGRPYALGSDESFTRSQVTSAADRARGCKCTLHHMRRRGARAVET